MKQDAFSQMALDFPMEAAPAAPPRNAEVSRHGEPGNILRLSEAEEHTVREEGRRAGVVVRIKTLKKTEAPPPPPLVPEPVIAAVPELPKKVRSAAPVEKIKSKRGRKSLKQVEAEADLIEIPADEVLFSKHYYTMGEVAAMFRVNQSLLRFWETEFKILQPRKNKKGDRYFRPIDIKNLHLIYHLLRQRKYTIEGAKEFLKKNKTADQRFEAIQRLQQIKAFLLELKAQL